MKDNRRDVKRLLLTGASGFLGGHIADQARNRYEVAACYCTAPFAMDGVRVHSVDLTKRAPVQKLLERVRPHIVLHCAAQSNLDRCQIHQEDAAAVNIDATSYLARWCGRNEVRFIYISSDMVFDGYQGSYKETHVMRPLNFYGWTKAEAEREVASHCKNYVIARSALLYGRPVTGGTSFSSWIEQRLREKQIVPLYNDQYRSPLLAANGAEALLELAGNEFTGILHLGGCERIDRYSFGLKLAQILGYDSTLLRECSMKDSHSAAPRPRDVSFCIDKAKKFLRTKLLSVEEGMRMMRRSTHRSGST